jgi:hypothetical protein
MNAVLRSVASLGIAAGLGLALAGCGQGTMPEFTVFDPKDQRERDRYGTFQGTDGVTLFSTEKRPPAAAGGDGGGGGGGIGVNAFLWQSTLETLDFLPMACTHVLPDARQEARAWAAAQAFGAPYAMKMLELDPAGLYDTAAEATGLTFVTTELRGGGTATAATVRLARRGLRNVLIHEGLLAGKPEAAPPRLLSMPDVDCYAFAGTAGMLEPCVDLGETVRAGQPLARIWPLDRSGAEPETVIASIDGLLAARRFPGLAQPGDTVAVTAVEAAM